MHLHPKANAIPLKSKKARDGQRTFAPSRPTLERTHHPPKKITLNHINHPLPSGQILFLIGLPITIGPQKTLLFFARRQKLRGTAAFVVGILLILLFRWAALIGFLIELYGILVLFGDFLGTLLGFARTLPVVGPHIGRLLDWSGLGRRNADLPV